MNELQQDFFDYGLLPINDAMELNAIKERVKIRLKRTAEDIIEIGKDLIIAKEKCGYGNFERWLKAEFGMSQDSAQRFMNVAKTFGSEIPHSAVFDFSAKALYLLSAPSTPELVREQVLHDAENGIIRTNAEIEEMKRVAKFAESKASQLQIELKEVKEILDATKEQRDRMLSDKDNDLKFANERVANADKIQQEEIAMALAKERLNNQTVIDAKESALAQAKKEVEKQKQAIEALKKQHEKIISDAVAQKLAEMQNTLNQNQFEIDKRQKHIDNLKQQEMELDVKIGNAVREKKILDNLKAMIEQSYFEVFNFSESCAEIEYPEQWASVIKSAESMIQSFEFIFSKQKKPTDEDLILNVVSVRL